MKTRKMYLILCLSFIALSSFVMISQTKPSALFNNMPGGKITNTELLKSEITVSDTNYVVSSFKMTWLLKDGVMQNFIIAGNKLNTAAKDRGLKTPLEVGTKVYFEEIKCADKAGKTIDLADLIFVIKE